MLCFVRSARVLIPAIAVACYAAILVGQEPKPNAAAAFGPTNVWTVHLEIPAYEFAAMQPTPGGFGGG